MGVRVDRTIIPKNICLGIDIYNFFGTWSMKKNVKMQILSHQVPTFWK
jgi:hypothetical protein